MSFSGKRALVTGAGKGIGRTTAQALAKQQAQVIALSRTESDLLSLKDEIGCEIIVADIADASLARDAVRSALPVDLLVNNAGIAPLASFVETTLEDFDRTIAVNTRAPMVIAQEVVRDLLSRNAKGAIVNVSSVAAAVGTPLHTAYCASKGGLDAMTRVMACELGGFGIRVNSVNPTVTLTPMGEKAWGDPAKGEPMMQRIPLRRFALPEEVAAVIVFLLGDEASMIHGACLDIDGGFRAV